MTDDIDRQQKRLTRERAARKEAERLLEEKSLALYHANLALQATAEQLEKQVVQRIRFHTSLATQGKSMGYVRSRRRPIFIDLAYN